MIDGDSKLICGVDHYPKIRDGDFLAGVEILAPMVGRSTIRQGEQNVPGLPLLTLHDKAARLTLRITQ